MRKTVLALSGCWPFCLFVFPARSLAQVSVGISVRVGPPALPVYEQPILPGTWLHLDPWLLGVQ